MAEGAHPYRASLEQEMAALSESVMDMLDLGCEMPFDKHVIACAAERARMGFVIRMAERDGRRLEAWLLRRHLSRLLPRWPD